MLLRFVFLQPNALQQDSTLTIGDYRIRRFPSLQASKLEPTQRFDLGLVLERLCAKLVRSDSVANARVATTNCSLVCPGFPAVRQVQPLPVQDYPASTRRTKQESGLNVGHEFSDQLMVAAIECDKGDLGNFS